MLDVMHHCKQTTTCRVHFSACAPHSFGVDLSALNLLNLFTQDGRTALDVATQIQGADSAVVQTLTKAGAKSGKQVESDCEQCEQQYTRL